MHSALMSDFTLSVPKDTNLDQIHTNLDQIHFNMRLRRSNLEPENYPNLRIHWRNGILWDLEILSVGPYSVTAKLFAKFFSDKVKGFTFNGEYNLNFEVLVSSDLDKKEYPTSSHAPDSIYSVLKNIRLLAPGLLKAATDAVELMEPRLLRATEALK